MADADTENFRTVTPSCDHNALKECLDRNNGDRSKCTKEWEAFQRSCSENKSTCLEDGATAKQTHEYLQVFIRKTCLLQVLLYPTVLRVFRRVVEGMNQVPGETARSSLTFASSMEIARETRNWQLWL
ncbi:uncharacterized protein [Pocillopora verrucosa]|uniref:uncharacterized protein n=1 Tax=Pocillopora verrucosa TaxID=203993 RepID=UPI003342A95C